MKNLLVRLGTAMALSVALSTVSGCGGTGKTVYFDVVPQQEPGPLVEGEPIKISIEPFEDRRAEKGRIGMRTHLWGGGTYFNVAGEKPGELYAQALAERLKASGWQDRSWNVRVVPAGSGTDADIVISGEILDFSANAKSKVFSTSISASNKLTITARNKADGSVTRRLLEGAQKDTVFWFEEEDVQRLLTATIKDAIDRYLLDTNISRGALRSIR